MTTEETSGTEAENNNGSTEGQTPDELIKQREINQRLQGKLTDIEKKYAQASSILKDIDVDEYRQLKGRVEEAEKKAAKADPEKMEELFTRKLTKFQSDAQAEKETLAKELEKLRGENKTLKVTDKVMAEIAPLFQPDIIKFIKKEVEQLCDLDEDGTIVVKDDNGDPIYRNGKVLGIKDFGEMLVEKYPTMAKAQGMGGSKDATPGQKTSRASGSFPTTYAELVQRPNSKELFERMRKEDPAAAQKILDSMGAR